MPDTTIYGTSGNDTLSGGNGKDTIHGLDGDDIISGGNGVDRLFGDGGDDQLYGDNGDDHLTGGADDDLLDGLNGFDIAYYSGPIGEYSFLAAAGYLHVIHLGGAGADGHDRLIRVERLVFADRVVNIGSGHNAPVAGDDHVFITEDTGTYSSGAASVKDNDFDFDGDALTVTGGTFTGTYGTLTLNSNGTYSYTLSASAQALAQGENAADSFNYTVTDNDGSDTGTLVFHIAGANDAPTANSDTGSTGENATILVNVLANDTDIDNGALLSLTAASAPGGQGAATVADNQVQFDPGTDFDDLAVGDSEVVVVSYSISDEHGASSSSTVTITVTGTNDGPEANPDTGTAGENAVLLVDVLANDTDVDDGALLTVIAASVPVGQGIASVVGNQVQFDPGSDFDYLAVGESAVVVVSYDIEDEHGAASSSTVTVTVTGSNDGPTANPDTATTGENATILVDVIANDTDVDNGAVLTVIAASVPAGQGGASVVANQVQFDPGSDFDDLAVGESEVVVVSYDIEDEHGASASSTVSVTVTGTNDSPVANPDADTTSENAAILVDVLANDTDVDDGAVLTVAAASAPSGQGTASVAGNQVQFDPGTDFDDLAVGDSAVVVVSYDVEDEQGAISSSTVAITVTGTNDGPVANPDTASTSENATILVDVLANDTDVDNGAILAVIAASAPSGQGTASVVGNQVQFDPGTDFDYLASGESAVVVVSYDIEDEQGAQSPSTIAITVEGADEGATITGTDDDDTLIGTDGDDTISALGGNDYVSGGAGADLIDGGAGFDQLYGDADDDVIAGGTGGDVLSGESGNDQLSGGGDDDSLDGGDGDDSLDGGDGSDALTDFGGVNSFVGGPGDDQIAASSSGGVQTIDGGDGNDTIRHFGRLAASTITTGSGSDTVALLQADVGTAAIVVTDFTPGAGGDEVGLDGDGSALLSLLSGWDGSTNPFGSGFLRLQQSGADTLFQWDRDGTSGGSAWETLAVFQNTDAGDFTDANFAPGYDPDGSAPAGETITGTDDDETLLGTVGDDTISALGGSDYVSGGAGADLIDGGAGFDQLYGDADDDVIAGGTDDDVLAGGEGNDQLSGEAGNDILLGESGNDQLSGGGDDDSLDGGDGDDSLDGGDGSDALTDFGGVNSFVGGPGDDQIAASSSGGVQTIDGGDGNDTIRHFGRLAASTITTGSGSDTVALLQADVGTAAIVVTDFTPGAGGDEVGLDGDGSALLSLLSGWDGSTNPFGSGFLRLQQSGADTLFQWDRDGTSGGSAWETLAVFQNTDAGDFTDANFAPGYDPDGSAPAGETITGTDDDETLLGTVGDDTISALGGSDYVSGGAGADLIDGGAGFDQLYGDADDDVIAGGTDDDVLAGGEGNDQLSGEAGNDILLGESGNDQLSGGGDDDSLDGGDGDDSLEGGDGSDALTDFGGVNSFVGGPGDDQIAASSSGGVQTIDGGDGNDTIRHFGRLAASTITTGSGSDTVALLQADVGTAAIVVTDFTPGAGGDEVGLDGDGSALLSLLSGWDGSTNPFGSGFLRLQQSGADTLFQWDRDGTSGGSAWETLAVFQNTDAGDFTDANFAPGYDPDGSAPAGETITGTDDDETLLGTVGDDTISALGGSDYVSGGAGADLIDGGAGFDQLYGDADDDVIAGGTDDDVLAGGEGNDQLSGEAGNDILLGESGNDQLSGGGDDDFLVGESGNDGLSGGGGDDVIDGGDGDDVLSGGSGSDGLYGGGGEDVFDFQSAADGPDRIDDFASGIDRLQISASGFGGGLVAGGTVSLVSGSDPAASGTTGQFLFDTNDGSLLWDADGTGGASAILIATLGNLPSLSSADFVVV